jgi:hypothetical protein
MTNRNRITEDSPGPETQRPGSAHVDPLKYPSGEQNQQGTNRNTDWDKVETSRSQFSPGHNDLTRWTLQTLQQGGRPVPGEKEQTATPPSAGFKSIDDAKQHAMRDLGDRLEKGLRGFKDGKSAGYDQFQGTGYNPKGTVGS